MWSLPEGKKAALRFSLLRLYFPTDLILFLYSFFFWSEQNVARRTFQHRTPGAQKKRAEKRAKIIEQQIRRGLAINDSSGLDTKLFFFLFFFSGGGLPKKRKKLRGFFFYLIFWGLFHILFAALQLRWEGTSVSLTERRRKVLASFFFSAYSFLASSFYSRLQPVGALHGSFGWGICLGGFFFYLFYPFFFSCCRENFPGCFLFWRCGYFVNSFSFYPWYVLLFFFSFYPSILPPPFLYALLDYAQSAFRPPFNPIPLLLLHFPSLSFFSFPCPDDVPHG